MQDLRTGIKVFSRHEQVARCTGSQPEQAPPRTAEFTADGFLRHSFLPLYEEAEHLPQLDGIGVSFFNSLAILEEKCGITVPDYSDKPYPYNILLTYWQTEKQFSGTKSDRRLQIVQTDDERVVFASEETVFNGNMLYYIPVLPLFRFLRSGRDKHCAELLLSVCAYLSQIAGIPHYREPYSFVGGYYDMMSDWLMDDPDSWEEQDRNFNRSALNTASHYGDIMLRRMFHKYNLDHLGDRISRFQPKDEMGRDTLKVAQVTLALWQSFPDRNLFQHVGEDGSGAHEDDDDYDEYSTLYLHEYVHFIAEAEGTLYDNIFEMLNNDFNEKQYVQEPSLLTCYDHTLAENGDSLDYEHTLLEIIDDLCTIFNQLP